MAELTPEGRALFLELIDVPADERGPLLAVRSAGAPALAAEVTALLAADAQAEGFLEPPALDVGPDDELMGRWLEGRRIGQYTVIRRIGIGGMGTVYVAEQARPRRNVALKLLRTGVGTRTLRDRFEREAEILGRLRHPGIAEIYEAGTHDSELGPIPFFALEYVPGARAITQYADAEHLDVRGRVLLLAQVCDAVGHAHDHGVVHRDIKPSNILVGSDGRPRLIDFGIARWADDDAAPGTLGTAAGELLGTLQYMSPEQYETDGAAIGVPSDVYALGVVLYELVAGRLPYPVDGAGPGRIAELVRAHAPAPVTMGHTRWRALDDVVRVALAKDPRDRHAGAAELAADLRRACAGEPVRAAASLRAYRLRRARWHGRRALPWLLAGGAATAVAWSVRPSAPPPLPAAAATVTDIGTGIATPREDDYLHQIAVAERAVAAGDLARAKAALGLCAPPSRGWEWHRLLALVDRSAQVMPLGAPAHALVFARPRGTLVAAIDGGVLAAWRVAHHDNPDPHPDLHPDGIPRFEPAWRTRLDDADEVAALVVDATRDVVYAAGNRGVVHVVALADGAVTDSFAAGRPAIWAMGMAGDALVLVRHDGAVERWDPGLRTRISRVATGQTMGTAIVAANEVYAALEPDGVGVHGIDDGAARHRLATDEAIEALLVDGPTLYVAGWDDRISAFDRSRGTLERQFDAQPDGLLDLVRTDGQTLVSAGRDGAIVLWDLASGHARETLRGHDFGVDALAVGGDGRWLASVSLDGTMRSWDLRAPPVDRVLGRTAEKVHAVAFHPDGDRVIAVGGAQWDEGDGHGATAWSLTGAGPPMLARDHGATLDAVAVSLDGRAVATASRDGVLVLRDPDSLTPRRRWQAHAGRVHALAFSPTGGRIVSGGDDGEIAIWTDDGEVAPLRTDAGIGAIQDLVWAGEDIVVGGAAGIVRVGEDGQVSAPTGPPGIAALAVIPGGDLVIGGEDGTLARLEAGTLATLWSAPTFGRAITDLAVSGDGARIAASSQDYRIRLHDAASGAHVLTVGAHASVATSVAFSPDGTTIASGGYDRVVRLWRAPTAVTPTAPR